MTLVILGGSAEPDLDEAVGVFLDSGFQLARWLSAWDQADAVLPLRGDAVALLKDADVQNIKYVLVHVGEISRMKVVTVFQGRACSAPTYQV